MRIHSLTDWPAELQAAALRGGGERLQCPACGGGRTRELSLQMTNLNGFTTARCWRASCGYFAKVPLDPSTKIGQPQFKPRIFEGELAELDGYATSALLDRYGIQPHTAARYGVKQVVGRDAIYMPVYGPQGHERGGMVRYFDGSLPKTVSYKATDQPWQAWYRAENMPACVIVEDQLSALRCWQAGYTAIALLGVNLNGEKAGEIQRIAGITVACKLALDADAFSKAVGYAKKYSWLQVVRLGKDLKDCNDDEILARLA